MIYYLLTLAGLHFAIRNIIHLTNEDKLRKYITTQPPGKHWVAKLGEEKTVALTKRLFLPLGTVVALGMFGIGVWGIYLIHFAS